jgi:hypothetical protein
MTITFTTFSDRILALLGDSTSSRYSSTQVTEALTQALSEYSQASPALIPATLTAAVTARLQPVTGLSGLRFFTQVSWPDLTRPIQSWYPVSLSGASYLHFTGPSHPSAGDSIAVIYAADHTITDLNLALSTTVPQAHVSLLAQGAAAHAAIARSIKIIEQMTSRASNAVRLREWGDEQLLVFRTALADLAIQKSSLFPPFTGWKIDRWDGRHESV